MFADTDRYFSLSFQQADKSGCTESSFANGKIGNGYRTRRNHKGQFARVAKRIPMKESVTISNPDGSTETKLMLRSEEDQPEGTTVDLGPAKEIHPEELQKPAMSSPAPAAEKKKLHFHMSNKIQIIPNNRQGQLNTGYLGTIAGVLKIAEIALSFLAFVLAICADRRTTTAAWTEHITFETMMVVLGLLLGYVCFPHITIRDEVTREGLIVVELLFYGINTLFYFISIWLMVHLSASWGTDSRGAAIMTAIICVALTVIFAIETVLKLKAWRGENEPSSQVINGAAQA